MKTRYFLTDAHHAVFCTQCGAEFTKPTRSRRKVCSETCKHKRKSEYGAAYRQSARDGAASILALFGGRKPTEDEIIALLRRKGRTDA